MVENMLPIPYLRAFLSLILLSLLALNSPLLQAQSATAEPTTSDRLAKQTQIYNDQAQALQNNLAQFKLLLSQAPREITQAQQALASLNKKDPATVLPNALQRRSIPELEKHLSQQVEQVAQWQSALTEANSMVIAAQSRPERAQAEINSSQIRYNDIQEQLAAGTNADGKPLTTERRALLQAEQAMLQVLLELRRQELSANSQLLELGKARRDLLSARIAQAENQNQALQNLINDKRSEQSNQTQQALSQVLQGEDSNGLLKAERQHNLTLSDYLIKGTEQLNLRTQQNLQIRQQLESINQVEHMLGDQIETLTGTQMLSRILRQQRQALPEITLDARLPNAIADLRTYQFELRQAQEEAQNPDTYIDLLFAQHPAEVDTPALRQALKEQLQTRQTLLDRLEKVLSPLLSETISLQLNQKQLQDRVSAVNATIEEHMFWIPSNKPIDLDWFQQLPSRLQQQFHSLHWPTVFDHLSNGLAERPQFFLPLGLLVLVLLWKRRAIDRQLKTISKHIGHYQKDSQLYTPQAFLLNLLLALPISLALAICGLILQMDGRGQNLSLGAACNEMALAWLVFYTTYRILQPGHMAEQHFRWSPAQTGFLHRNIGRLGLVVMIMMGVVGFATHQTNTLSNNDVLSIVILQFSYLLLSLGLLHILLRSPASKETAPLRTLLGLTFSLLSLGLIVAVGLGYYYTALRLTERLADTLYLGMAWLALEAILVRSLRVAARRLAYKRMLEQRQAEAEGNSTASGIDIQISPHQALEQINQQSLRLTRMALYGSFAIALYWVWADLISVVDYLDNFLLYESGSGENITSITLRDLLGALLILLVTLALARNLPGLLEVMVLSRLQLAQGSAYATSTLLSYSLIGLGLSTTLSALGVSWDQLQWLVAALSVGLGFGLQEIFANFVSGLIILFERPVRIGDVVTIGSLSGKVTRIRIRATTITDFDRKEIIVPNKTFITSQLINWTLSDTITRVTLKVGVAYGSDLALVRHLLLEAATSNSRVLRDPAPEVFFLTFDDSTLGHELRIHVKELGDRIPATDEINRRIDEVFNEHGISIAFRQVDIFIKNLAGQELQLPLSPSHPMGN